MRPSGSDAEHAENPYRAPRASLVGSAPVDPDEATWCWRDGDALVVLKHRPLPLRCVKCNRAVDGRMRAKRFIRFPPWLLVFVPSVLATPVLVQTWRPAGTDAIAVGLILSQCLLFAAIYLRSAWLHSSRHAIGLCPLHRHRRTLGLCGVVVVNATGVAASMALSGRSGSWHWPAVATALQLGVSMLLVRSVVATLRPVRIDGRFARFAGCGPSFLYSLAGFPEGSSVAAGPGDSGDGPSWPVRANPMA